VEIAAFVAAGCWAVYTFVYQTRIAPLFQPAHETASINAQRIGETASNYLERVTVTLRNDGNVDVDTAALATSVLGLEGGKDTVLHSHLVGAEALYRQIPLSSWTAVGGYGQLFAGAIDGPRGRHLIMRAGDVVPLERLFVVPRKYRVLAIQFQTVVDRYPINPPLPIRLGNDHGVVTLKSNDISISFDAFFPV
jgi:hypothetical protein